MPTLWQHARTKEDGEKVERKIRKKRREQRVLEQYGAAGRELKCLKNGAWILCLKTMVRRCKNKNITQEFTRTVGRWIQSNRLRSCLCVHAHAGWWSTASCQHHRDTALIGTRGASVHHRQARWLNSLALKGPSHQNFHLLFSFADHLFLFFFFPAQVENLAQTQVSSMKLCFSPEISF